MAEAKGKEAWGRMSALLALVANAHRDPKKTRAFKPADFDPYAAAERPVGKTKDLSILKRVFVDGPGKEQGR
jgi:hypothetical protein